MKHLSVVQHTQSEWLGAIEDHLEGRGIRFGYFRPFTAGGALPDLRVIGDGLVLLGGGPWGTVAGDHRLSTLDEEVRLARACLMLEKPVLAFGLGAQILSLAADGATEPAPLRLEVGTAHRTRADGLGWLMPERFPSVVYMRDRPLPPTYASILATDDAGYPAVFGIGRRAIGFAGHPGIRRAMLEDLVMEFETAPADAAEGLARVAEIGTSIEDALVPLMAGIVAEFDWM